MKKLLKIEGSFKILLHYYLRLLQMVICSITGTSYHIICSITGTSYIIGPKKRKVQKQAIIKKKTCKYKDMQERGTYDLTLKQCLQQL